MTAPMDVMDFFIPRTGGEKIDLDIPGSYVYRNDDSFIDDIWPSNPDEFLDSILNENGQLEGVLDDPSPPSSDSGCLSNNENLEFDDEILSTTLSSPGPSISEVGMQGGGSDSGSLSPQHDVSYSENKPIIIQKRLKPLQTVRILNTGNGSKTGTKLIRVQSGSNPRSILLPVSVKDLRTIKIINPANLKNQIKLIPGGGGGGNIKIQNDSEESINTSNNNTLLQLTPEESRLLAKEGIQLPTTHPLTRHEERELKRIRRKIRNKISAQDSRKRKKEYVDGLEDRVRAVTTENTGLLARIKMLQAENAGLVSQLRKLQALVGGRRRGVTQPSTCLMVLLLSLALIALPNIKRDNTSSELISSGSSSDSTESIGKRVLLFKPDPDPDDLEEFLQFPAKRAKFDTIPQWDDLSLDGLDTKRDDNDMVVEDLPIDWGSSSEQRSFEIFDRNKSKIVVMNVQESGGGIIQIK